MKKKVLIIGFGSIAKKHANILANFKSVNKIAILTSQKKIKLKKTIYIKKINEFDPDLIFVCSKTSDHYSDILKIEKNFKNKIVLIEKPLLSKYIKINFKKNKYFVGYNLRFHPVLNFLKKKIKGKKIFSVDIKCSSYLPNWRSRDYRKIYSSNNAKGGGVLLDLSHELDYLQWLFGRFSKIEIVKIDKISKLEINVEDRVIILGKINSINININMNFFSRFNERHIILNAKDVSLKGDLLNQNLTIYKNNIVKKYSFIKSKKFTYIKQSKGLLSKNFKDICTLREGLSLLKLFAKIRNAKK